VSGLPYLRLTALRTRAPLPAVAASLFAVAGTFAGDRNEVGSSWALTALLGSGVAAWLTVAVLGAEPGPQADMATVALGGRAGRSRLDTLLVATVATSIAALFLIYPLVLSLVRPHLFEHTPNATDILVAAVANVACCAVGASLGVLLSPPRISRRASSGAATLAALLALLAVGPALGAVGGPAAFANRLSDAPAGTITGGELIATASCLVLTAALLAGAAAWGRRRG
jgi:hypothetical protein